MNSIWDELTPPWPECIKVAPSFFVNTVILYEGHMMKLQSIVCHVCIPKTEPNTVHIFCDNNVDITVAIIDYLVD